MAYTSGLFYVDHESGSDTARSALTSCTASNPSGTITRINKTAHGLVTGAVVDLTLFTAWLNAAFKITVVDADNFDLDATVWQATADASGTVTPRGGSSKADAWKTISSGATAARHAAGDTIRIKASPDETLVGNATWTEYSKTITLAGAVTANIATCETAWTGSANVTQTADISQYKEGTKAAKSVIAAGFTTGIVAYFATGTLDLSGYQQVSFWFYNSTAALAANTLSLRLCSDAVGAVTVHTIAIPAMPSSFWVPLTVDLGSNMNSAIASISLYADLDPGAVTVYLDNIIACKASSSADALTLTSLLGKVHNKVWVASTTYAVNDIRKPTQPNRNGWRYKVTAQTGASGSSEPTWPHGIGSTVTDGGVTWTCEGLEDTWYPIQSINGTTVKLDNGVNTQGNAGRGYSGATETVATYKREPINLAFGTGSLDSLNQAKRNGTPTSPITYTGGWDRTSMAAQNGETWLSAQNGYNYGIGSYLDGADYLVFENINGVRHNLGVIWYQTVSLILRNCQFSGCTGSGFYNASAVAAAAITGLVFNNNGAHGLIHGSPISAKLSRFTASGNGSDGINCTNSYVANLQYTDIVCKNNGGYGINDDGFSVKPYINLTTGGNGSAGMRSPGGAILHNALIQDTTEFSAMGTGYDAYIWSSKHDQTANNHIGTTDGGTIISATDQRNTPSGISWKFRPTSTARNSGYPLRLSVAKIACLADMAVNLTIYARRDSTNIQGRLLVRGGQIAGVGADVSVSCAPSINTWIQSSTLTFTPTENGVVEVHFEVWDGTTTDKNMWIDDFAVA